MKPKKPLPHMQRPFEQQGHGCRATGQIDGIVLCFFLPQHLCIVGFRTRAHSPTRIICFRFLLARNPRISPLFNTLPLCHYNVNLKPVQIRIHNNRNSFSAATAIFCNYDNTKYCRFPKALALGTLCDEERCLAIYITIA